MSWNKRSVPGSVKPVYGAQYPPLAESLVPSVPSGVVAASGINPSPTHSINNNNKSTGNAPGRAFAQFAQNTVDAWDADDEPVINPHAARQSANQVLAQHAAMRRKSEGLNLHQLPHKSNREQALQRLATQKAASSHLPGNHKPLPAAPCSSTTTGGPNACMYPRLPVVSETQSTRSASETVSLPNNGSSSHVPSTLNSSDHNPDQIRAARLKSWLIDGKCANTDAQWSGSFTLDLVEVRKMCWKGIPHKIRPQAWRLLSGYLPTNVSRREETLKRKRDEYFSHVEQYFHTRNDDQHYETFRQIHIDIPRMCPLIPLFQQKIVQEIFERILYIWAIRHPASGYVQGINDLVTPFFVVFLSEFITDDIEVGTYDVANMDVDHLQIVEADSFWCFSAVLDSIQDNYTFAQPGIQRKIQQLQTLMSRVDNNLHVHLINHQVEYLQFTFRWMNNLLMREVPLRATIRLWDTYMSEPNGFSEFHVYVCAAFLRMWSRTLQQQREFHGIMMLLQNLPTQSWGDQQICELTADAFSLKCLFDGAKNHLS